VEGVYVDEPKTSDLEANLAALATATSTTRAWAPPTAWWLAAELPEGFTDVQSLELRSNLERNLAPVCGWVRREGFLGLFCCFLATSVWVVGLPELRLRF
jgi:hypothetical protein